MATTKKLMGTTAAAADGALAIEDVFSTYLYTGTGAYKTITNGIDLAGEGGMVWIKQRSANRSNGIFDTERGATNYLLTDSTTGELTNAFTLTNFYSDGFRVRTNNLVNILDGTYASWTFRKAPRFFDVVTYTGDGTSGRSIAHNLGVAPGCMIVKYISGSTLFPDWWVYHRGFATPETSRIRLNSTDAVTTGTGSWGNTNPTSSVFYVGASGGVITNESGVTYVAYLFAHDPLGPSGDGSDGLIACGSYTGNGSSTAGPEIDLGWEPQWLLIKNASRTNDPYTAWHVFDNMRGLTSGYGTNNGDDPHLLANTSGAEVIDALLSPTATGFKLSQSGFNINYSGDNYIYIAIRRGPMRQPTSGTEVFSAIASNASNGTLLTTGFPVDAQFFRYKDGTVNTFAVDRLRGVGTTSTAISTPQLRTNLTDAEASTSGIALNWSNTGFAMPQGFGGVNNIFWSFRRAPGFFDAVAYTGDGTNTQVINHNLGVEPELVITKRRSSSFDWGVYHDYAGDGNFTGRLYLNSNSALKDPATTFFTKSSDSITVQSNSSAHNASGSTYIAYLFATLPGVSKVGSYTGNGTSQNIDCGFTTGARFLLIKKADDTGHWQVYDTARGIVAGNDPRLVLNLTSAELTGYDFVDPYSGGFAVTSRNDTNENGYTYIYLAIA